MRYISIKCTLMLQQETTKKQPKRTAISLILFTVYEIPGKRMNTLIPD